MLVLSRDPNQWIVIQLPDKTLIRICNVCNHQIKLGFVAPDQVKVYRQEIFNETTMEGQSRGICKDNNSRSRGRKR